MPRSSEPYVPPLLPGPSSEPGWSGRRRRASLTLALTIALTIALVAVGASTLLPGAPLSVQPANGNSALGSPYGAGPSGDPYGGWSEDQGPADIPTADPGVPQGAGTTTDAPAPAPRTTAPRVPVKSAAPDTGRPSATSAPTARSLAAEVIRLTNAERKKAGCGALKTDDRLNKAAVGHARDMVKRQYFDHVNPDGKTHADRIRDTGFPPEAATGENIAMGYDSAAAVVAGWMNSAGHKRNILNCDYTRIGAGYDPGQVRQGYAAGAWVQVFAAI